MCFSCFGIPMFHVMNLLCTFHICSMYICYEPSMYVLHMFHVYMLWTFYVRFTYVPCIYVMNILCTFYICSMYICHEPSMYVLHMFHVYMLWTFNVRFTYPGIWLWYKGTNKMNAPFWKRIESSIWDENTHYFGLELAVNIQIHSPEWPWK